MRVFMPSTVQLVRSCRDHRNRVAHQRSNVSIAHDLQPMLHDFQKVSRDRGGGGEGGLVQTLPNPILYFGITCALVKLME